MSSIFRGKILFSFLASLLVLLSFSGCDLFEDEEAYSVSGQVLDVEGEPLEEVRLNFSGGLGKAVTNEDGKWTKTDLEGTVTITPVKEGYNFDPQEIVVTEEKAEINFAEAIFEDPNLQRQVKKEIGRPDSLIFLEDVEGITELEADNARIESIEGIQHMSGLENLALYGNKITDISPLETLSELVLLDLNWNKINDLSSLEDLENLQILYLRFNEVTDFSNLGSLQGLKQLAIEGNPGLTEESKSAIGQLDNLTLLNIGDLEIENLNFLEGLTGLDVLYLWDNNVEDISPLSALENLEVLLFPQNQVQDITPLGNLEQLEALSFGSNQVNDVSILSNLSALRILAFDSNQVSNLSALEDLIYLETLIFVGNQVEDISPLVANEGFGDGDEIDMRKNLLDLKDQETIDLIDELKDRGVIVEYQPQQETEDPVPPGKVRLKGQFAVEGEGTLNFGAFSDNDYEIPGYIIVSHPDYGFEKSAINKQDGSFSIDFEYVEDRPVAVVIFATEDMEFYGYLTFGEGLDTIPLTYIDGNELDLGELFKEGETVVADDVELTIDEAERNALTSANSFYGAIAKSEDLLELFLNDEQGYFLGINYWTVYNHFQKKNNDETSEIWGAPLDIRKISNHTFEFQAHPPLNVGDDPDINLSYPDDGPEIGLRDYDDDYSQGGFVFETVEDEGFEVPPQGDYEIFGADIDDFIFELPDFKPEEHMVYSVPEVILIECSEKEGKMIIEELRWEYLDKDGQPINNPEKIFSEFVLSISPQIDEDDLIGDYDLIREYFIIEEEINPGDQSRYLKDKQIYWQDVLTVWLDYNDIYGICYHVSFQHYAILNIEFDEGIMDKESGEIGKLDVCDNSGYGHVTFELVDGEGDSDNDLLEIQYDHLRFKDVDNFEKGTYEFRVRAEDEVGNKAEEAFEVKITEEDL